MPYVRTVKTASGATAVQIVYSSHRGSRDIKHIGSAGDDAELEEEVKILRKAAAAVEAVVRPKAATAWSQSCTLRACGPGGPAMPSQCHDRGITPGPSGPSRGIRMPG